jgi:hypothetical protein
MTTLREAAQQALERLMLHHRTWDARDDLNAITALRAALAQEEREDIAQNLQSRLDAALLLEGRRQEIAQPRRETEQEPVATVAMDVSGAHLSWNGKYLGQKPDTKIAMLLKDLPVGTLLFTAPPRREWRGLTMQEINALPEVGGRMWNMGVADAVLRAIRAIEDALKEKNNG